MRNSYWGPKQSSVPSDIAGWAIAIAMIVVMFLASLFLVAASLAIVGAIVFWLLRILTNAF